MLVAFILFLTVYWLLSFFSNSMVPNFLRASGFTEMLAIVIVLLIMVRFLT